MRRHFCIIKTGRKQVLTISVWINITSIGAGNEVALKKKEWHDSSGLQSAYRRGHSTETALLKVISDILMAAERGQVTTTGAARPISGFRYCRS